MATRPSFVGRIGKGKDRTSSLRFPALVHTKRYGSSASSSSAKLVTSRIRNGVTGSHRSATRCAVSSVSRMFLKHMNGANADAVGQITRDLQLFGLRFAFISTYEETVFLKIVRQVDDTYALLHSPIINNFDPTVFNKSTGKLSSISMRTGLFYLLHRAASEDSATWKFDKSRIEAKNWTIDKTSRKHGLLGYENYESPFVRYTPSRDLAHTAREFESSPIRRADPASIGRQARSAAESQTVAPTLQILVNELSQMNLATGKDTQSAPAQASPSRSDTNVASGDQGTFMLPESNSSMSERAKRLQKRNSRRNGTT